VKTISFIVIAPLIGFLLGTLFMIVLFRLFRKRTPGSVDSIFRRGQLVSAAMYSLGHGSNDAQKTMGIIASLLYTVPQYQHLVTDASGALIIPMWIVLMAHAAIALGTLSGGWRIIHTMGSRITRLVPMGGFAAETAGAISIFTSTALGIPVSTTQIITGAIIGVGSVRRRRAVRWSVAGEIVWAWVLTIPVSAGIAAAVYLVLSKIV
jgi:inorganic phosphate transporter, PiT family